MIGNIVQYIRAHQQSFVKMVLALVVSIGVVPLANLVFRPLWAPEMPVNTAIYLVWIGSLIVIAAQIGELATSRSLGIVTVAGVVVAYLGFLLSLVVLFGEGGFGLKLVALGLAGISGYFWLRAYPNQGQLLYRKFLQMIGRA